MDTQEVHILNTLVTQDGTKYELKLDTRPYYTDDEKKYTLNSDYMYLIWYKNGNKISDNNYDYDKSLRPTRFAFAFSTSKDENENYIYIMVDNVDDVAKTHRDLFKTTIPLGCNEDGNLKLPPSSTSYYLHDYDSVAYNEKYKDSVQKTLIYTISNKNSVTTIDYKDYMEVT